MSLKDIGGVYTNAILICCREDFDERKFENDVSSLSRSQSQT